MTILQKQISPVGEERSIYSQVDSLANPLASQDLEKEKTTTVTSGRKCSVLYERYDPLGSLVRTLRGILSMVQPGSEVTVESQASLFDKADKETILEQEYVIETVCRDLEREGYSVQPILIPACGVGAPHKRYRVWFIASDRSDARIEGLRQKRKDKVHGCLVASDTDSPRFQAKGTEQQTTGITGGGLQKDATDTYGEKLQKWLKNNGREIEEENIARLDNGVERSCCIRAFADSDNERLSTIGITDRISSEEREKKRRCLMQYTSNDWPALSAERWKDFPTQPPVCRRNDGLPFDVDYLAISFTKWRQESIKAYGNAIVPQVAFEIFKAIDASIHSS